MRRSCLRLSLTSIADKRLQKLMDEHTGSFGAELLRDVQIQPAREVSVKGRTMLVFPLRVLPSVSNSFNALHGGAYAALADVFTTVHLWSIDPKSKHVSADFNIQYYAGSPVGSEVTCVTEVTKMGKRLSFTRFTFECDGKPVAEGSHTKAMLPPS